jgi:membrane protein implicated in regulation of membrane protease activity
LHAGITWLRLAIQDAVAAFVGLAVSQAIIWLVSDGWHWDWLSDLFTVFLTVFMVRLWVRRASKADEGSTD